MSMFFLRCAPELRVYPFTTLKLQRYNRARYRGKYRATFVGNLLYIALVVLLSRSAFAQVCSWEPSTAFTKCGVVGKPANFSFESLSTLQNGNLFTWHLDSTELAVFEYNSGSKSFNEDVAPISRVVASSKYISDIKSEHSLTIKSLTTSDDGKSVTFQREGCSAASENAQPVTLSISCCDPSFFGSNATTTTDCKSAIKCGNRVTFSCNEAIFQPKNFTTVCQANSTWDQTEASCEAYCDPLVFGSSASTSEVNITLDDEVVFTCNTTTYKAKTFTGKCQARATWNLTQHTCVPKICSILPSNSIFTDPGVKNISGGESKNVSCGNCATVASTATGTCITDDNVITVTPPLICTPKSCSVLPANSMFENNTTTVLCGEPAKSVVCSPGFTGLSGTTGTCSNDDDVVTLSQNLTCSESTTETCSILPKNVVFTDPGTKNIFGGESKSVSCDNCSTVASTATGTCVTDDNVVTVTPNLTCTPKRCTMLPASSMFEKDAAFVVCGDSKSVVCSPGFTGLSGTTGTCSSDDGNVTLSQKLACTKVSSESNQLGGGAIAGIIIACLVAVGLVCGLVYFFKIKGGNKAYQSGDTGKRLTPVNTTEPDENDPNVSFKPESNN